MVPSPWTATSLPAEPNVRPEHGAPQGSPCPLFRLPLCRGLSQVFLDPELHNLPYQVERDRLVQGKSYRTVWPGPKVVSSSDPEGALNRPAASRALERSECRLASSDLRKRLGALACPPLLYIIFHAHSSRDRRRFQPLPAPLELGLPPAGTRPLRVPIPRAWRGRLRGSQRVPHRDPWHVRLNAWPSEPPRSAP